MAYLLYVDLDVFLQGVAVQVEHEVVNQVKPVTHNDQWQLVRQLRLLADKNMGVNVGIWVI